MSFEPILTKYVSHPNSHTLDFYLSHDGYKAAEKAVKNFKPDDLIEEVKKSGLRGRGGAGFSCGMKWSFVPKQTDKPKYLVCNADESEPGTFKDRLLIERDPHQLIEGIIIACWAVQIHTCYIYIRGEFIKGAQILQRAVDEAYTKNFLGDSIFGTGYKLDITIHRGAGAYICGEETAMLSSIEGDRGYPKIKPPFPAVEGLFRCPTVINNVETLTNLPHIVTNGADWYRKIGTEKSTGPKIFGLSGHIKKPGLYELPLGTPIRELIYNYGGGILNDKKLKAVVPGGSSSSILTADEVDLNPVRDFRGEKGNTNLNEKSATGSISNGVKMDFDTLAVAGSMLGTASVIVMDEDTCIVDALWNVLRFYAHESCGQCTPCREGMGWLAKVVGRIERGSGMTADIDIITDISNNMVGRTICVLADAAAMPAKSYVKKFRSEFEQHVKEKMCPLRH